VNANMWLAAWRMSSSSLRGSCGIQELAAGFDRPCKPRIPNGSAHYEIDFTAKQILQSVHEAEISVRVLAGLKRQEFYKKIQIASRWIKFSACC